MTVLFIGLLIWTAAHLFKPLMPAARARLAAGLGDGPSRGVMAAFIALGLALMVIGFRTAPVESIWFPPSWTVHINNLLMLVAVALLGLGHSKSRARSWVRDPMLTGVIVWAGAHLLVNGDVASILLFGWMGVWAIVEMVLARRKPAGPVPAGSLAGDIRLGVITLVVFAVIVAIHTWLGYPPFPQG
ncbi:MAG: NnrU family protein [Amaricoccus sp.]|uniref:NnrU family protein n=1 Tax=Amaricoccus sp. TaxID=1872485 RepID=UPI0039E437F9